MFNWTEFWTKFWEDFSDKPNDFKDVENIIFQKKNGDWVMVVLGPNSNTPMVVKVDYNPWSGEELPALVNRDEEIARAKRSELSTKIRELTSDMHGYEMAHYNSSDRAEKIRWTKRIKTVKAEIAELDKQRLALG